MKDFLPLIRHVHLKDWNGGPHWAGYCPLGQGKVDLPGVLDLLEQSKDMQIVMVEFDPSAKAPMPPIETARISKEYLQSWDTHFDPHEGNFELPLDNADFAVPRGQAAQDDAETLVERRCSKCHSLTLTP